LIQNVGMRTSVQFAKRERER